MNTIKRDLKDGIEIGGKRVTTFEMRTATAGDMFDAEMLAPADKPVSYEGALVSRQLVMLGDVPGPIDMDVIRRLSPGDFNILYSARNELEAQGKSLSSSDGAGTS